MDNCVNFDTILAFILITATLTAFSEAKPICKPGEYVEGASGQCRRCAIPCTNEPKNCPPICKGWEEIFSKKRQQEKKTNPITINYDPTPSVNAHVIKADWNQTKDDRKATTSIGTDLSTVVVALCVIIGFVGVLLVLFGGVALVRSCTKKRKRKEDAEAPKIVDKDQVLAEERKPLVPRHNPQPEGTDDGVDQQQQVPGENPGPGGSDNAANDNVGGGPSGGQEAVDRRFGVGGLVPLPSAAAPSAENLVPNDQRSVGGASQPSGENQHLEGVASDAIVHGRRSLESGEPQAPTRGDNGTHGGGCAQVERTGHSPLQADVCANGDKSGAEGLTHLK